MVWAKANCSYAHSYRYLKDAMVKLEELKIQLCFYVRFLIILLANRDSFLVMPRMFYLTSSEMIKS